MTDLVKKDSINNTSETPIDEYYNIQNNLDEFMEWIKNKKLKPHINIIDNAIITSESDLDLLLSCNDQFEIKILLKMDEEICKLLFDEIKNYMKEKNLNWV